MSWLRAIACIVASLAGVVGAVYLDHRTEERRSIWRRGPAALLLAALLSLPQWSLDRGETPEQRAQLVAPVAAAIVAVTDSRTARAFLAAQAWHETRLARYVLEDRCSDGPVGARCDRGHATGPWQVHRHCKGAWDAAASQQERLESGARCALRGYHWGRRRCGGKLAGGFAAQHSSMRSQGPDWCAQPWALTRVATTRRIIGRLR